MQGTFITFEGIEGSGKSTQIALLAASLKSRGLNVILTREPGGTSIGDQIRKVLLDPGNSTMDPTAELLLYAASRTQHLKEVIRPHLQRGGVVLCDRFSDATLAYQGYGRGLALDLISTLDGLVREGLRPDLTILLDIDAEVGVGRARGRNDSRGLGAEGRFENEELRFHERVRQGYLAMLRREPVRIRRIDASRSVEDIAKTIRTLVDEALTRSR